jgi:signal transduction histidine kinase
MMDRQGKAEANDEKVTGQASRQHDVVPSHSNTSARLSRRPSRPPDYEAESRAMALLMPEMANSPEGLLHKLAETALDLCRAHSAGISFLEEDHERKVFRWHAVAGQWSGLLGSIMPWETSPSSTVLDQNRTILLSQPGRHVPFPSHVVPGIVEMLLIPFRIAQKPVGTIWVVAHDESRQFDGEDERLMSMLCNVASMAHRTWSCMNQLKAQVAEEQVRMDEQTRELHQSQERVRALAVELNLTEQRERQRLAADLHDYLGQLLTLSRIKVSQAKKQSMEPSLERLMTDVQAVTDQALAYIRTLVSQLIPPILDEGGLPIALLWLAEQMRQRDLAVSVQWNNEIPPISKEQAAFLFQSVRELLINCIKHAGVRNATVILEQIAESLHIRVSDQGRGFDPSMLSADTAPSFGLYSIRERMRALGGRFDLQTAPGKGTTTTLVLPLV